MYILNIHTCLGYYYIDLSPQFIAIHYCRIMKGALLLQSTQLLCKPIGHLVGKPREIIAQGKSAPQIMKFINENYFKIRLKHNIIVLFAQTH